MNEEALRQYRLNQRRLGKLYRGKVMPRLRHLTQEARVRIEPFWMPMPRAVSFGGFASSFLARLGHLASMPFLSRKEREWRK